MHNTNYLMHHGIKGMKWGVRRFEDASGHLTPAGKRRYAVQDARKYYKINRLQRAKEKTRDPEKNERLSKRIRRVQTRSDRKHADLNTKDINIGRQIVAKNRRNWAMVGTAAKAAATAAGAYALYQNPKTRALAPLAVAGGAALTYGSAKKVPYYTMEARRYKQVNPKGATNKGLTKRQQALRKAGKVAAGAVLAGAAGYALYKTGAGEAAINAGKKIFDSRTGINTASNMHDISQQIVTANKAAKKQFDKNEASAKRRNAVKSAVTNTAKAAKSKIGSSIKDRLVNDVDADDPRTWVTAARNAKNVASDIRRYGSAANSLRKGDVVTAASEVSDEITDAANSVTGKVKKRISKLTNKRKSK